MKEKIIAALEKANKEKKEHEQNYSQLSSAREKCIAVLNLTQGKIEQLEELLKEEGK